MFMIGNTWDSVLADEFEKDYFLNIKEFIDEEYQNYKIVNAIESQRVDYPSSDSGHHSFVSFGSNGVNFGVMS